MSTLNPDQWRQISPYLDQALEMVPEERTAWLSFLREKDANLASILQSLLDEQQRLQREGFLESSLLPTSVGLVGERIGAYTLVSQIGQGGMGTVWLARRSDGRFERQAAVKFVNVALAGQGSELRFRREGSILGRLTHPHIAELLDAGISSGGQPYLILEYVDGVAIDQYCDGRRLDLETRIRLFLDVLTAVAYAHANLIVHRDLKPSNVLVTSRGEVKLLDFGIAKLLEGEGQTGAATLLTHESGSALTPQYAAPEQLKSQPVTTATDVYALGVLLYVLLTGRHPAGPGPYSPAELMNAVLESEPLRVSDAVGAGSLETVAECRSTTTDKLQRQLRGDLDTIVAKALKKSPEERYRSVTAFADDLGRYLKHEPISARADTLAYRTGKFVRRNRTVVALTTLAVLAIISGVIGILTQTRTARRERDTAFRERDRADRIAQFMTEIFKVSDPNERVGNSVTAREVLDKASQDVNTGLSKDPDLQAQMMHVMGKAYRNLGLLHPAQRLLERSIQIGTAALGQENPKTLETMQDLAWAYSEEGRYAEAEALQRRVADSERRVLGPEHLDTLRTLGDLAVTLCEEGNYQEGIRINRQVVQAKKRLLGPEAFDTLAAEDNLAVMLNESGQLPEAEKVERETLDIQIRVFGYENLGTISSMTNMADIERNMGRNEEAQKLYAQTLQVEERVLGPDQRETAVTKYELGCILAKDGQTEKAFLLLNQAIDHGLPPRMSLAIETEPMLSSLRGDPRFAALVLHGKKQVAAQN